ncbi:hypothetical protein HDV00_004715 [Rhizophlyctis rosea]|nr:hypothetical protein HDV00_004715 [Rhizophlyctis rosea]
MPVNYRGGVGIHIRKDYAAIRDATTGSASTSGPGGSILLHHPGGTGTVSGEGGLNQVWATTAVAAGAAASIGVIIGTVGGGAVSPVEDGDEDAYEETESREAGPLLVSEEGTGATGLEVASERVGVGGNLHLSAVDDRDKGKRTEVLTPSRNPKRDASPSLKRLSRIPSRSPELYDRAAPSSTFIWRGLTRRLGGGSELKSGEERQDDCVDGGVCKKSGLEF